MRPLPLWFVTVIVSVCVLAAVPACHRPSLRAGARTVGAGLRTVGGKLAVVMKPVGTVAADPKVQAIAAGAIKQAAHERLDRAIDQGVDRAATAATPKPRPEPAPQGGDVQGSSAGAPAPQPIPVTVTRVNLAKPTMFVMRYSTRAGKNFCEAYPTSDDCNTHCTSLLRMHMFSKPDANTPQGCTCMEQDGGC